MDNRFLELDGKCLLDFGRDLELQDHGMWLINENLSQCTPNRQKYPLNIPKSMLKSYFHLYFFFESRIIFVHKHHCTNYACQWEIKITRREAWKKFLFIISVYTFATAFISFGYYQSRWGKKLYALKNFFLFLFFLAMVFMLLKLFPSADIHNAD